MFHSTIIPFPQRGRAPRVEKARPRPAAAVTGQFGLSAEPRPPAQRVKLDIAPPPPAAALLVQTPKGPMRSEAFEDWLSATIDRLRAQRPGRIVGAYALEVQVPRDARARDFGALERPLIELLSRARIVRRGLRPERFSVAFGGEGRTLAVALVDCLAG